MMPVGFSTEYQPKERKLTAAEVDVLLAELGPDHAARAAFMVATSANWGETERAKRLDVSPDLRFVHVNGTKTETRDRVVPLVTPAHRSLLEFAVRYAGGKDGAMFAPWSNIRRDLHAACKRAGIPPCRPNDLRRTFADCLVEAGVPLHFIAPVMGHKDTRMLERVYGRQTPKQLEAAVARALGLSFDCHANATGLAVRTGLDGLAGLPSALEGRVGSRLENTETQRTSQSSGPRCSSDVGVPGGGIEPPTRGFSVPCSTI